MMDEMTAEKAVKIITYERDNDIFVSTEYREKIHEALTKAIQALEQQPCEDCVSRESVLRIISNAEEMDDDNCGYWIPDADNVRWNIQHLPPVTPERPKGKWIEYKVDIAPHPLHCSLCGFSNYHISNKYIREFRRCPNCGAEISGGEADEND